MNKMAKKNPKETPMMKQYNGFKAKYPGTILLFRVGDFYETFGQDAILASKILGITLTKRHNGAASEIELAGFPHHSLDNYLSKLVKAGQRVAVCDQIEDPKLTKKLVKRGVTELVTPGVAYHDHVLDTHKNNYLAAIAQLKNNFGLSLLDISTGEFILTEGNQEYLYKLLRSFEPSEILISKSYRKDFISHFPDRFHIHVMEDWFFQYEFAFDLLTQHFKTKSLKGFGIEELKQGIAAAGTILHYLNETNHKEIAHISQIARIEEDKYVWLDQFTIRNLELLFPQQIGGVSLIEILDKTVSPMGARLLRKWVALPLKEKKLIEDRLQIVEVLYQDAEFLEILRLGLKKIGDLERMISKVASRRIKPRELLQIKRALQQVANLRDALGQADSPVFNAFVQNLDPCQALIQKIDTELKEEPKAITNEGDLIKDGVNAELDELRDIVTNSKSYLEKVRENAIKETLITSLKIGYNKVFGYYLEVTNAHKNKVPKSWIRKQTLTGAERYITEELKIYEDKIVHAEEQIAILELRLFQELVLAAADFIQPVQKNARLLARLDCLGTFAYNAQKYHYTPPKIESHTKIQIKAGRHPVIERQLPSNEPYIPNDTLLDDEAQQILVITGPNMAGKSALLRQVALITLMAQIGSFVPAEEAEIGLVDKIFTRVGASDNLAKGESTFMVEMMETASIMNNLSDRSLVLMDEIGRGTSTYDGISIAWAILEFLHNSTKARAKTLFATHYHELNELAKDFDRIKNFHVTVKEVNNKIVFMRKLAPGGSEHSFGIHVAQMAGMPNSIVSRANEIMHYLEENRAQNPDNQSEPSKETLQAMPKQNYQLSIFDASDPQAEKVKEILKKLDVNSLSPIEALLKLNELKGLLS